MPSNCLSRLVVEGQMARSRTYTQSPPIEACTPYPDVNIASALLMAGQGRSSSALTDTGHSGAVERWPETAKGAERCADVGRKDDVVDGARVGVEHEKECCYRVSYDDAQPSLPPCHSGSDPRCHRKEEKVIGGQSGVSCQSLGPPRRIMTDIELAIMKVLRLKESAYTCTATQLWSAIGTARMASATG